MRFYEPDISENDILNQYTLGSENTHHFSRVLRGKVGQKVFLFNGHQGEFEAEVIEITKCRTQVHILAFHNENRTPHPPLSLVIALCNKQKMSWIIEKSIELGVSNIFPIITQRAQRHRSDEFTPQLIKRYQKIIISAATQAGINQLASLHQPCHLHALPWEQWQNALCYLCDMSGEKLQTSQRQQRRIVFVGPEGGWSDEEKQWLIRQGCIKVQLAHSTLRMETAAIAALAMAQ